jgi:hypothetical protein
VWLVLAGSYGVVGKLTAALHFNLEITWNYPVHFQENSRKFIGLNNSKLIANAAE